VGELILKGKLVYLKSYWSLRMECIMSSGRSGSG
jgi:hypothetical protein